MTSELALQNHNEQATNDKTSARLDSWCQSCVQNFHHVLNHFFTSSQFNVSIKYLSTLWIASFVTPCPMCQFLDDVYGSTAGELQHQIYAVYAISCLRYYALRSTSLSIAYPELEDSSLWVILPVDRWSSEENKPSPESVKSVVTDKGCIALLDSEGLPETNDRYQVRLIDPDSINWDLVKSWVGYCAQHHGKDCRLGTSELLRSFVVIDCEDRTTCELPANGEFLALSYVWGPPAPGTITPTICGSKLPKDLPLVVEDAITVTKRLGFRYLWVDRFCISDDDAVKHTQIKNMDLVYQSAHATIIATAGEDPSYGLPGVSSRSRRRQPQVRMGSNTLASTLPHPGGAIRRSKWATRAWTYQECLLSRRRIFFTDEQAYFECQSMHCCESFGAPLDALHIPTKDRFRISMREGLFPLHGQEPLDIWSRIEEYTQREMTYDSDALNGMLGLLRVFRKKHAVKPMFHLWGLPIFSGLYHQPLKPRREVDQFVKSLCWRLTKPSNRRQGFPSWSWTGWKGAVCTKYAGSLLEREFSAVQDLEAYLYDSSGQEIPWQQVIKSLDTYTSEISTSLSIRASTFRVSFYRHPTQSWTPKVLRHRTNELAECNPFYICKSSSSDPTFLNRLHTEYFTGIVIGDSQNCLPQENLVLVVDEDGEDGDGAERIGFFVLRRDHVVRMSRKTRQIKIQ